MRNKPYDEVLGAAQLTKHLKACSHRSLEHGPMSLSFLALFTLTFLDIFAIYSSFIPMIIVTSHFGFSDGLRLRT